MFPGISAPRTLEMLTQSKRTSYGLLVCFNLSYSQYRFFLFLLHNAHYFVAVFYHLQEFSINKSSGQDSIPMGVPGGFGKEEHSHCAAQQSEATCCPFPWPSVLSSFCPLQCYEYSSSCSWWKIEQVVLCCQTSFSIIQIVLLKPPALGVRWLRKDDQLSVTKNFTSFWPSLFQRRSQRRKR